MAMTGATSRHVWQVAELVRRLDRDEIRELIRLVPRLQREVRGEQRGLVQWARERMAQYTHEARPMRAEDAFIGDRTVEAYFALPEAERERIWDELYAAAIETAQEREVKPDAVVSAR
jgi:phage pi2 protein 07